MGVNDEYIFKPPVSEWDETMRRRFAERFGELRQQLSLKYEAKVRGGVMGLDDALGECLHEVLQVLAAEFGLLYLRRRRR